MWAPGPYRKTRYRVDMVRRIGLEDVLKCMGCLRNPFDKTKWHTPQGPLSIRGEKFFNWTTGVGGGGAIDLVIHLMDYDFKSAVSWLACNFSISDIPATFNNRKMEPNPNPNKINHRNGDGMTVS